VMNLRSPMLETGSLASALTEIGRRTVDAPTRFDVSADPIEQLPQSIEEELLRIGQEAITNAARHARATRIQVDLRQHADSVRLDVRDDGCGFDVDAMWSSTTGHYGLTGMRERAARAGGRVTVNSSSSGTHVEAVVPCRRRRA